MHMYMCTTDLIKTKQLFSTTKKELLRRDLNMCTWRERAGEEDRYIGRGKGWKGTRTRGMECGKWNESEMECN